MPQRAVSPAAAEGPLASPQVGGSPDRERQTVTLPADSSLLSYQVFQVAYWNRPHKFAQHCIQWGKNGGLTDYQLDILQAIVQHRRVAVRAAHSAGKSACAAIAVLWFALSRDGITDWKIPMTASAWRQLTHFLAPEIHKWAGRIIWEKIGRPPFTRDELMKLSLHLSTGEAFAMASDNPAMVEGAHASALFMVYDEAKRLDINTPIPTPGGWTTMGEIEVGDTVFDEMGKPTRVIYVSPILCNRPCVRVKFNDDSEIIADPGHLWAALSHRWRQDLGKRRRRYGCPRAKDWRLYWDGAHVTKTVDLVRPKGRWAIPTCCPLELPERELPIDPYVLGAWLGDGAARKAVITSMDADMLDRIAADGHELTWRASSGQANTYGIVHGGLETALRKLDLLQNKHIPDIYLRASTGQRLSLLQGLMDTDGTSMGMRSIQSPRVSFTNTSRELIDGVAELVRTFGWKVRIREGEAKLNGKVTGPFYIVRWSADICPFHIQRKATRWVQREVQASRSTIRTIVSVEPVPSVPTRCIAVDSERHLYLAGKDFIPTHNTIPDGTWDATEGAMASGDCYALAISTPGEPAGRFYEIHAQKPGLERWWTRHVTKEEIVAAGRMDLGWAEQRRRQWGKGSPLYQNRVLGEFAEQMADGVIPLAYVERAQERWREWEEAGFPGDFTGLGVDVGGGRGGDPSALARCYDGVKIRSVELRPWERDPQVATMSLAGRVKGILDKEGGYAIIDGIGLGAGIVHRGREQGSDFRSFIASGGNDLRDQSGEIGFANNRAAMWWLARDLLSDPSSQVCLPPDGVADPSGETSLLGELIAPKWKELSNGRVVIESKKDIRKRLGRSTDLADACLQILTGPRVLGAFGSPSIGNLASEMAQVRSEVAAEVVRGEHLWSTGEPSTLRVKGRPSIRRVEGRSRVGAIVAGESGIPQHEGQALHSVSGGQATLRYVGEIPSLVLHLDGRTHLVDPGWERVVEASLAREVAEGLPKLFTMEGVEVHV